MDLGCVRRTPTPLNSCMLVCGTSYQPVVPRAGSGDAMINDMFPEAAITRPESRLGALAASPLGPESVTIRTLPRVEPKRLGRTCWARSSVRTASSRLAQTRLSPLASRLSLWASFWSSSVDWTASTQQRHGQQVANQPARRDRADRWLPGLNVLSAVDVQRHTRSTGIHPAALPLLTTTFLLPNDELLRGWPRCSWGTTGASMKIVVRRASNDRASETL